jgi:hypothetical protein
MEFEAPTLDSRLRGNDGEDAIQRRKSRYTGLSVSSTQG